MWCFSVVCVFKFVFSVTSVFGFTTAILNKRTPPGLLDRGQQGHLEASSQKSQSCVNFTFYGYDLDQLNETSHDKIISPLLVWTILSSSSFHRQIQAAWCHVPSTTWHDFVLPNIKYDYNKRHFITRSLFIMSKFYVIVLCARVCIAWTVFSSIMLCDCYLCKHVRLSCVFYNKPTYLHGRPRIGANGVSWLPWMKY